jgi:hypothetical protein
VQSYQAISRVLLACLWGSADPLSFVKQLTTAEVLETGIKVVDLLSPYAHAFAHADEIACLVVWVSERQC